VNEKSNAGTFIICSKPKRPQSHAMQQRRRFLRSSAFTAFGIATGSFVPREILLTRALAQSQPKVGRIWVDVDDVIGEINKNIYGHMAEHVGRAVYDGIWVGKDSSIPNDEGFRRDAIQALCRLKAPQLRWPGGCFADAYHWKDGVGPNGRRPKRWNLWWEQYETNAMGTDEFIRFCRLVGAEPYICLNVGSGSVQEAVEWIEYCNSDKDTEPARLRTANGNAKPYGVRYWAVGNENWGCGGLYDPEHYAREYLRYALYLKRWIWPSRGISAVPLELVAVGHTQQDWNQIFLEKVRNWLPLLNHLSIHHYFRANPGQPLNMPAGGPAPAPSDVEFSDNEYYLLLSRVDELKKHIQDTVDLIGYYAAGRKKIGLVIDEWGTWHSPAVFESGFFQQNTLRDAIIAGSVLNLFHHRCRDITMANLAQAFNVLQSIGLTEKSQMVLTPTFYVMEMYGRHQGTQLVRSRIDTPAYELQDGKRRVSRDAVNVSASLKDNRLLLTAVNEDLTRDLEFEVLLRGAKAQKATGLRLWSQNVRDHNTFNSPERVKPMSFSPELRGAELRIQLPAHSVNAIEVTLE
jgi:alpha-N-arabinofuranosidase